MRHRSYFCDMMSLLQKTITKGASMKDILSQTWGFLQAKIFPIAEEELGPLSEKHTQLLSAIGFAECRKFIRTFEGCVGRPQKDRESIAHAFIAKAIFNISQTKTMIEWIKVDATLRRICGWETKSSIPSEATFSRAFAEFAKTDIAAKIHEAFIKKYHSNHVTWHVSRDSTAIAAREKAVTKPKPVKIAKKRGRPAKGTIKEPVEPSRLLKQLDMDVAEMLADLPKQCDFGCKKDSKGYKQSWCGYKLHIDTTDGDIPVSAILTSASVHDSQVALPLRKITESRIPHATYELMDSAYDAQIIRDVVAKSGHVAVIDFNRRSKNDTRCFTDLEAERYKARSSAERVNSYLKDNCAGMMIRVKGHAKIFTHLMFSLLAITIDRSLKLLT
jgi:hypothetical protein